MDQPSPMPPFNLYRELRFLLFAGVVLVAGGLGRLLYVYSDRLDHALIAGLTLFVSLACFAYCLKVKEPFSRHFVNQNNAWFDYALLLACLTLVAFLGYIQYHFHVFNERYGLLTFTSTVILLFVAFYFDHRGVLGMGITSLAAWLGITLQPAQVFKTGVFSHETLYATGAILGVALQATAWALMRINFKAHFSSVFQWFALHLFLMSSLVGMINSTVLWLPVLVGGLTFYYAKSLQESSRAMLLFVTVYFYIGLSYWAIEGSKLFLWGEGRIYGIILYFIGSAAALIYFLNKQFKARDKNSLS